MDDSISPHVIALAQLLVATGLVDHVARTEAVTTRTQPYTVQEIAAEMRVHESTVYRAIQSGDLEAYVAGNGGRGIRVEPAAYGMFKANKRVRGRRPAGAVA